jgi:AcrR family transcriptional regulator
VSVEERLSMVPRPVPVLSRKETAGLTSRQRELLDALSGLITDGFSHLTMADLARDLGCSLRTLYGIAPSRDLLVLVACDRNLWAAGRSAREAIGRSEEIRPLDAVRRYLQAATRAVNATTAAFAADMAALPGGQEISDAHTRYLVAITRELLDMAVERGEIEPVPTIVLAHAMAGISNVFIQPDVIDALPGTPKQAADSVVDLILRGLTTPTPTTEPS